MMNPISADKWYIYFLIVNLLGFMLNVMKTKVFYRRKSSFFDKVSMAVSLIGGAAGTALAIALTDRKITKENVWLRIWTICILLIQIFVFLLLKMSSGRTISFNIWGFFKEHRGIFYYLAILNVITFAVYGIDKYLAVKNKHRIKIVTLLGLSLLGGSIGGLAAVYFFRHKTKKKYFTAGIPLMIATQICILLFLINRNR